MTITQCKFLHILITAKDVHVHGKCLARPCNLNMYMYSLTTKYTMVQMMIQYTNASDSLITSKTRDMQVSNDSLTM